MCGVGVCVSVCVRVLWCSVSMCVKMGVYVEWTVHECVCCVCMDVWGVGVYIDRCDRVHGYGGGVCACVYACVSVCVPGTPTPPAFPPSSPGAPGSSVAAMRCTNSGPWSTSCPAFLPPPPPQSIPQMGNP